MIQHLIVPVDESAQSWKAFEVAYALAVRCEADVRLVQIEYDPLDRRLAEDRLKSEVHGRGPFDVEVFVEVRLTSEPVASELDRVINSHPDSVVVMASHGRGRSAAILGSVAADLLRRSMAPILLVGPHVTPDGFVGPLVVAVDGSDASEGALPIAATWSARLGSTPWIVHVADPITTQTMGNEDIIDTAYPSRLAKEMRSFSGHAVEYDELHGTHADVAVTDFATGRDASLIVATSHGRSGLSRLALGSVAAGIVRHATCPVLVIPLRHAEPTGS